MSTLPVVPEWEPVLASQIAGSEPQAETDRSEVERLAVALGVQALRWPTTWPPADTARAMLAATYAKHIGRGVAFSLAAFRQTFAGGRDIGDENTVLIAGAACEMHPVALTKGIGLRSTADALEDAQRAPKRPASRPSPRSRSDDQTYEGAEAMARGGAIR